ncbi:MAG: flagellar biosynthesis protein FlgM, partial [Erysipelotrichaceae bacterium]|nr:flagellar biosynthesis protein FlgM [Erysipelotrichaceae bacterium]
AGQRSETSSPSTGNQNAGTSGGQGSSTANTGSSSGSNGAQSSTPSQPKPSSPAPAPSEPYIVDDGRKLGLPISMQSPLFDDPRAAEAWADQYFGTLDENSPYYDLGYGSCPVKFSDGSDKYSIYWY